MNQIFPKLCGNSFLQTDNPFTTFFIRIILKKKNKKILKKRKKINKNDDE